MTNGDTAMWSSLTLPSFSLKHPASSSHTFMSEFYPSVTFHEGEPPFHGHLCTLCTPQQHRANALTLVTQVYGEPAVPIYGHNGPHGRPFAERQ